MTHPVFPHAEEILRDELERFAREHPRSQELAVRARRSLLAGVPMHWMVRWAGGFPVYATDANGARFRDVDGREYVDLCLGDTGAMTGHSPEPTVRAVQERVARGITLMLPSEDALWVGEELSRRFGLARWQFALTATDANRFAIRLARHVTGRPKILVYNWCYHGTVDETVATLDEHGAVVPREGSLGPPVPPAETTRVVEWNDVEALEAALAHGDVACVLAEPALTNIGIVPPQDGYHEALRELTRRYGTLLIIDETHTLCAGPGGYTRAHGLEPTCSPSARRSRAASPPPRTASASRSRRGSRRRCRRRPPTSAASAARSPRTSSRWPRCGRRSARCSPTRRSRG